MKEPLENKEPKESPARDFGSEQVRQREPQIATAYVFFALVEIALLLETVFDYNHPPGPHFLYRACCFQAMLIAAFLEFRRGLPSDRSSSQGDRTEFYVLHLTNAVLILLFALLLAPTTFRW